MKRYLKIYNFLNRLYMPKKNSRKKTKKSRKKTGRVYNALGKKLNSKGRKKTKKNRKGGAQSDNFIGPESCEIVKQNEMYTDCCNLDNEETIRQLRASLEESQQLRASLEESQELLTDALGNLRGCMVGRRNLERELRLRLPETKQEHRITFQSHNVGHPRLVLVPPTTPSNIAPRFAARPRPGTAADAAHNNRTDDSDDDGGETKHTSGGG